MHFFENNFTRHQNFLKIQQNPKQLFLSFFQYFSDKKVKKSSYMIVKEFSSHQNWSKNDRLKWFKGLVTMWPVTFNEHKGDALGHMGTRFH